MSGSDDAKLAWLKRVLGVRTGAPTGDDTAGHLDLKGRLLAVGNSLRGLRDGGAPEAAGLAVRYAELVGTARTDAEGAAGLLTGLEADIARAVSAARGREAPMGKGRGVAYRKLLLRWREAQGQLAANLGELGATLLARPDIKADPRLKHIEQAVAALPKLVPTFSGALEEALNDAMSTADPAERARLDGVGRQAIDVYRQHLTTAAAALLELEKFAATSLGAPLALHAALDGTLLELKAQLAA